MKVLSAPIDLCFGITNQCNLNCKHCLAASTRASRDLSTAKILDIVRQIEELKIPIVAIFGGEPLMREDFFTILKALSKLKINLTLNTNGTLITRRMAKELSRCPVRCYTVSLDGASAEVQDPFRGSGSFAKSIEGIRNLIRERQQVLVSTIVTRFNFRDLENICLLAREMGVWKVRFNNVAYTGNAACYHRSLLMTVAEKFELMDKLRDLKAKYGDFVNGYLIKTCDIFDEMKDKPQECMKWICRE